MRSQLAIGCVAALLVLASVNATDAQQRRGSNSNRQANTQPNGRVPANVSAEQQRIMQQVRQIELTINRETQLLEQHLNRAQQIREQALKSNNAKGLEQAEQIETQAFQRYEARLRQIEQASLNIEQQSRSNAQRQQQQAGLNGNASRQQQQQQQQQRQQQSNSGGLRLFRFGR